MRYTTSISLVLISFLALSRSQAQSNDPTDIAAVKEVEQWVSFGELNHKGMACSCAADAVLSQLSVDRASVEEYANDNLRIKRYVVVCCDVIEYFGFDAMCSSRAAL